MNRTRYVGLDVRMPDHPRVAVLADPAFRAFVEMICYSGEYLTDGFVPCEVVQRRWHAEAVQTLVDKDHVDVENGGYRVRHYLDWNPSRAEVEALRASRVAAGRQGGLAKHVPEQVLEHPPEQAPSHELEQTPKQTPSPVPVPRSSSSSVVKPSRIGAPKGHTRAGARKEVQHGTSITADQAYLLGRLYDREGWADLTPGGVVKLNQRFGVAVVHTALQRLHEETDTVPEAGGYALLLSVCQAVKTKQGGGG